VALKPDASVAPFENVKVGEFTRLQGKAPWWVQLVVPIDVAVSAEGGQHVGQRVGELGFCLSTHKNFTFGFLDKKSRPSIITETRPGTYPNMQQRPGIYNASLTGGRS
jgi:hypothetical protein